MEQPLVETYYETKFYLNQSNKVIYQLSEHFFFDLMESYCQPQLSGPYNILENIDHCDLSCHIITFNSNKNNNISF